MKNPIPLELVSLFFWIVFETVSYQLLLLLHHLLLYRYVPSELFGQIALIFSCIYLLTALFAFGIHGIIATFYTEYATSKQSVTQFITSSLKHNLIGLCLSAPITFGILFFIDHFFLHVSLITLIYAFLIILGEIYNRGARQLVRLSGGARDTAYATTVSMLLFILLVWGRFFVFGISPTINYIFGIFLLVLIIEAILLTRTALYWHQALIHMQNDTVSVIPHGRVWTSRMQHLFIDYHHLLLAGHTIIPFIALTYGINSIGEIKILITGIRGIANVIEKIYERASIVLFAHTKRATLETQQHIFSSTTTYMNNVFLLFTGCAFILFWFLLHYDLLPLQKSLFEFALLFFALQIIGKLNTPLLRILALREDRVFFFTSAGILIAVSLYCTFRIQSEMILLMSVILCTVVHYVINLFYANYICQLKTTKSGLIIPLVCIGLLISYAIRTVPTAGKNNSFKEEKKTVIVASR